MSYRRCLRSPQLLHTPSTSPISLRIPVYLRFFELLCPVRLSRARARSAAPVDAADCVLPIDETCER
jgi:hypothetical protein